MLGALLEDSVPVPSAIATRSEFRWAFGAWIIVCVFLSNCYNGLMITGLNSPLAGSGVETWRDVTGKISPNFG